MLNMITLQAVGDKNHALGTEAEFSDLFGGTTLQTMRNQIDNSYMELHLTVLETQLQEQRDTNRELYTRLNLLEQQREKRHRSKV